jgi:hypothetical protein
LLLRILFLIFLAYIIFAALKVYFAVRKTARHNSRYAPGNGDEMVLDPQCQTYVPRSEALFNDGNYFCSRECANLFLSR